MSALPIFTIPPQADFIAALAAGLWADSQRRGVALADYRILLPTRRAARALRMALTPRQGAMLLPRLQSLGEIEEEALDFDAFVAETGDKAESLDMAALPPAVTPPTVTPLRRRLLLARLLRDKYDPRLTSGTAWQLAGSLAALLDDMQIHECPASALYPIVPAELAEHWQRVLEFLQSITHDWPLLLQAEGRIDPVSRHRILVARQIELWRTHPPTTPILAAGSTASMPATAQWLQAIARLPAGMVVLPGLDQTMAPEAWEALEESHPQHSMRRFLRQCGMERRQVSLWPHEDRDNNRGERARLLQTALLPASCTALWQNLPSLPAPWPGLTLCVTENPAEESLVIALSMREILLQPDRTAMLVTRDRRLATRVASQLRRWDIHIDDSAGQPLAMTPLGGLLQLVLAAAQPETGGLDILALLKHPLTGMGRSPAWVRSQARQAEIKLWRGHRRRGGMAQHAAAADSGMAEVKTMLQDLSAMLQPLTDLLRQGEAPLVALLSAHAQAAEAVAATQSIQDRVGTAHLWNGESGQVLAAAWHEALASAEGISLRGQDYPAWLRAWLEEVMLRPAYGTHPRLSILGPLEARLLQADRVIIGGLNEDSWPGADGIDPWLSRPMRAACELPLPERQIGQAAHDFVQLASRGEVLLTRARKQDGQPTTPSRFLLRLETVLQAGGHDPALLRQGARHWLDWARALDRPEPDRIKPMEPPSPKPAVALRPRQFSVTEIGAWRCNPYGFYAKRILRLKPLDPLEPDVTQADFGNLIHAVLQEFVQQTLDWPGAETALDRLRHLGEKKLASLRDEPVLQASWRAQFHNLAQWLVPQEDARHGLYRPQRTECGGAMPLTVDGRTYELKGRADRIDSHPEGLVIIDYKTGHAPTDKEVTAGYEPQLPLLGLLAAEGAFPDLQPAAIHELLYYQLAGRNKDSIRAVKNGAALIDRARAMLQDMLRDFASESMPYLVSPVPNFVPRYDDYEHLGRMAEWGLSRTNDEAA